LWGRRFSSAVLRSACERACLWRRCLLLRRSCRCRRRRSGACSRFPACAPTRRGGLSSGRPARGGRWRAGHCRAGVDASPRGGARHEGVAGGGVFWGAGLSRAEAYVRASRSIPRSSRPVQGPGRARRGPPGRARPATSTSRRSATRAPPAPATRRAGPSPTPSSSSAAAVAPARSATTATAGPASSRRRPRPRATAEQRRAVTTGNRRCKHPPESTHSASAGRVSSDARSSREAARAHTRG
jgi:hypothetical protein